MSGAPFTIDDACQLARAVGIVPGSAVVMLAASVGADPDTLVLVSDVPAEVDAWRLARQASTFGRPGWALTATPAGDVVAVEVVPS